MEITDRLMLAVELLKHLTPRSACSETVPCVAHAEFVVDGGCAVAASCALISVVDKAGAA